MQVLDLGGDPAEVTGFGGRNYYRLATITWSQPEIWEPQDRCFPVPQGWSGHGGVYAFIRHHGNQTGKPPIAYIGKANRFEKRLTNSHNHFDIIERRGDTSVSCGRIRFERIRARAAYYEEIEDIIKFAVYDQLENSKGFESLPGFRKSQPRVLVPWVITNEGYSFHRRMPKRIVYPAIAIGWRRP